MDSNEKRAARLRDQLGKLNAQRQEVEKKLAGEHEKVRQAGTKSRALIDSLPGADDAAARRMHKEIDQCDEAIRMAERMADALQGSLEKIAHEVETLGRELVDVEQAIAAETRAAELRAFEAELKQTRRSAEADLAAARQRLAELTTLAFRASEQLGAAATMIANRELEGFVLQQANLGNAGWREATPQFMPLRFFVTPMVRA